MATMVSFARMKQSKGRFEMVALRAQGRTLRAISAVMGLKGHKISHVGVDGVLKATRMGLDAIRTMLR